MNSKRLLGSVITVFSFIFILIVIGYQHYAISSIRQKLVEHAKAIERNVWNFDEPNISYLKLAAQINNYAYIIVRDDMGVLETRIDGPSPTTVERWLMLVHLIPVYHFQIEIEHVGQRIGMMTVVWRCTTIYIYTYVAICLVLLAVGTWLFIRLSFVKTQLEIQNQELQRSKEATESANRAKSLFLASMSHELRTPLNTVLGFSQLMARDPAATASQRENLDLINRSGQHLLTLIDDVLEIARIEAGRIRLEPKAFDLNELLRDVNDIIRNRAEDKGLSLEINQIAGIPRYIRTDPAKLRQILINLLSNAIKYTEEGWVQLRVMTSPETCQKNEESRMIHEGSRSISPSSCAILHFSVTDSGIGINSEALEQIFKPFEQVMTSGVSQGTGLGLAITRQYVEFMGGKISVESTPGKGSIFSFTIQVELAEHSIIDTQPSTLPKRVIGLEPGQPVWRILIVEDHPESRLLLKRYLKQADFEVREAINGQEAMEIFQEWQPHFIWMDWRMPVMDGVEATRRIRSLKGGQKAIIVALTASVFKEQHHEIMEAGCNDFLRKPFQEGAIFEMMAKHLGVRYQYMEEPTREPSSETMREPGQFAGALATLPPDLLDALHSAVMELDVERISHITDLITERDAQLARTLRMYTNELDYSPLLTALNIIHSEHEEGS